MWVHHLPGILPSRGFRQALRIKKPCWIIWDMCLAIMCRHLRDSLRSGGLDQHQRSAWICMHALRWPPREIDQRQWAHYIRLGLITSTTATMTWLACWIFTLLTCLFEVWTNQLVRNYVHRSFSLKSQCTCWTDWASSFWRICCFNCSMEKDIGYWGSWGWRWTRRFLHK